MPDIKTTSEIENIDVKHHADILKQGYQIARNLIVEQDIRYTTVAINVVETLATLGLATANAYFYLEPAAKYGEKLCPSYPQFGATFFSFSTTFSNFLFAVNACNEIFKEFHKPNGKPIRLAIILLTGAIGAFPTFFMHLMEGTGTPLFVRLMAIAVSVGAIPVQALGILNFVKSLGLSVLSFAHAEFEKYWNKNEKPEAIFKLRTNFLNHFETMIEESVRQGKTIDFSMNVIAMLQGIAAIPRQISTPETFKIRRGFVEYGGMVIGGLFSMASAPGSIPPGLSTFYGMFDLSQKSMSNGLAAGLSGATTLIANFSPTMLAMIYGYRTPKRLWGHLVNLVGDLLSSIWHREFKIKLPVDVQMAKIGALIAIAVGVFIASGSFATAEKLLQDTLNVKSNPDHPHVKIISQILLDILDVLIKVRVITLNITAVVNVCSQYATWVTKNISKGFNPSHAERITQHEALLAMLEFYQEADPEELVAALLERMDNEQLAQVTGLPEEKVVKCRNNMQKQIRSNRYSFLLNVNDGHAGYGATTNMNAAAAETEYDPEDPQGHRSTSLVSLSQ